MHCWIDLDDKNQLVYTWYEKNFVKYVLSKKYIIGGNLMGQMKKLHYLKQYNKIIEKIFKFFQDFNFGFHHIKCINNVNKMFNYLWNSETIRDINFTTIDRDFTFAGWPIITIKIVLFMFVQLFLIVFRVIYEMCQITICFYSKRFIIKTWNELLFL